MIVGLYQEIYDLSLYTGAVWLTSINYWREPDLSWRYYLDITVVRSGILYHLIRGLIVIIILFLYYSYKWTGLLYSFLLLLL